MLVLQVKKGRYPGGPKSFLQSKNVLNGGASDAEVERLWWKENGISRTNSRRSGRGSASNSGPMRTEMVHKNDTDLGRIPTNRSRMSYRNYGAGAYDQRYDGYVARDGCGPVQGMSSKNAYAKDAGNSSVTPGRSTGSRRWRH